MAKFDRYSSGLLMRDIEPCQVMHDQLNDIFQAERIIGENFTSLKNQLMVCLRKSGNENVRSQQIDSRSNIGEAEFYKVITCNQKALERLIQALFWQIKSMRNYNVNDPRFEDFDSCTAFSTPVSHVEGQPQIKQNFRILRSQLLDSLMLAGREDLLLPQITPKDDTPVGHPVFNEWTTMNQGILEQLIQKVYSRLCKFGQRYNAYPGYVPNTGGSNPTYCQPSYLNCPQFPRMQEAPLQNKEVSGIVEN